MVSGGMLAVGLPVFMHLLRKQTTVPRPVSSLMFFEQGTQSSMRHRRLRYLLLFALRTLLVLLLALAFANPFFRHKTVQASDKLLLVVVDNSFSMNAAAGRAGQDWLRRSRVRWRCWREGVGQKAQVMALGGQMQVLTQPMEDAGELRAAVEGIQPGDAHGNFGELGRGMRAMAETVHTPMELHLFSDMQESKMPGNFADMVMPGNVSLVLHRVGRRRTACRTGRWRAWRRRGSWWIRRKRAVHGGDGRAWDACGYANGFAGGEWEAAVATKKVDVPANGRATVAFEALDVPYGESRCAVTDRWRADGFPADDASGFAVKRADPERVLFVHQARDSRSPLYFGTALAAAAQASFVLQPITAEQTSGYRSDEVCVCGAVGCDVDAVDSGEFADCGMWRTAGAC